MVAFSRPSAGKARPYHFPAFERGVLTTGVKLLVARIPKLPLVTLSAVIAAGAAQDSEMREGAARLTARLLVEGTKTRSATELARDLERMGTSIVTGADWDSSVATATSLTAYFDEVAEVLGEILREPTFPERELQRLRSERIADLLQIESEPRALADEAFEMFLYTTGSRFAIQAGGSKNSVEALSQPDVLRYHESAYIPEATTLIVAGDISYAKAEETLSRVFEGWQARGARLPSRSNQVAYTGRRLKLVNKRDAPQSELRVGHAGIRRGHPDYFPVVVMNAILGGLFGSRINLNLRETHGYTYGVSSFFDWRKGIGPFVISTAVQTEVTAAALTEIFIEIDKMREHPVSASELSLAKDYLDGVFPIRYETTSAVAAALSNMVVQELPADYFDTYRQQIQAVSADQVLSVAQRHLHPEQLQTLIVGDTAAIRESLEGLGLGVVVPPSE